MNYIENYIKCLVQYVSIYIFIYMNLIINKKNKEIKFPKSIEIFKVIIIFLITGEYSMVNISWPIVTGKFIYSTDN